MSQDVERGPYSLSFSGLTVPAVSLVLCGYLGSSMPLAILFLTLGVGLNGLTFGGYKVNQLDIAASQAGALSGITNTFANVPGIVSPQITKLIAKTVSSCESYAVSLNFVTKSGRAKYTMKCMYICMGNGSIDPHLRD